MVLFTGRRTQGIGARENLNGEAHYWGWWSVWVIWVLMLKKMISLVGEDDMGAEIRVWDWMLTYTALKKLNVELAIKKCT